MHINANPPVLAPQAHWSEIERLSKAALMDMVWSFATRCAGCENADRVLEEFRNERAAVLAARK